MQLKPSLQATSISKKQQLHFIDSKKSGSPNILTEMPQTLRLPELLSYTSWGTLRAVVS